MQPHPMQSTTSQRQQITDLYGSLTLPPSYPMTVRTAEILVAIILALCSIGLMVKSAELNIGWIEGRGPGSGAWPGARLWCLAVLAIDRNAALLSLDYRSLVQENHT